MKSCLVIGYMHINLGDDLFFKILFERYKDVKFYFFPPSTMLNQYKEIFKKNKNVCFYDEEQYYIEVKDAIGDDSIPINLFPMILERAKEVDFYINIGGSIFIQNPSWKEDDRFKIKEVIGDKPSFIIGCNFGPGDKEYHDYFENWFKEFDDICFRDKYSYNKFKKLDNARLADDIVLLGTKKKNYLFRNKKRIGISVIDIKNHKSIAKYKDDYIKFMRDVIEYFRSKKYKITLFSYCEEEGDLDAIEEILEEVEDRETIDIVSYEDSIDDFLREWKKNEIIISTRFHAMILALKYRQSFVALSYSDKTKNFLKDIDNKLDVVEMKNLKNTKVNELSFVKVIEEYDSEKQFEKIDKYLKGE